MKKKFIIPIIILLCAFAVRPAFAAHELSTSGDVIVDVQDELGNTITGATVTLQLPSDVMGFTGLDDGLDISLTKVDGVSGASGDDDGAAADGDVEFDNTALGAAYFDGNVWSGAAYRVTVKKTGYVDYIINDTYSEGGLNIQTSANKFTVKVILKQQAPVSNALKNGTINIYNSDLSLQATVADGADADSSNNGTIYIAQDPDVLDGGPHTVEATAPGYIYDSSGASTINSGSQTAFTFELDFPFVITADEELGGAVTLTTAAVVTGGGTLTQTDIAATGNTLYWAATGGPGDITITQPGYITTTTTLGTYTYSDSGPQVSIALDGTDGPAMDFGFVVTAAREGDSAALTLSAASSTFSYDPALTMVDEQYSAGSAYVAAYGSDVFSLTQNGYLATSTTITFASAAQQAVSFSGAMFSLKVVVYNEAGTSMTGCTINHGGSNQDYQSGNTYYLASTAAGSLSVSRAQYMTTNSTKPINDPNSTLASIDVDTTTQTVVTFGASGALGETSCTAAHSAGDAANCTGLLFPLKVILYDELGYDSNMATATVSLTANGAADASRSNRYFWIGGIANDSLSVTQNGYENLSAADDAALGDISGNTTNRSVVTLSGQTALGGNITAGSYVTAHGIKYGFKIVAEDEFGNPVNLNASETTVTPDPFFTVYTINYSGGAAYMAATTIVDDQITLSHAGYVDVRTTGVWGYDNTTQQVITFDGTDGPAFKYTLLVAVFDELNNPIDEAILSSGYFAVNGEEPDYILPASNVMYFAITSNGAFEGYLGGFVHEPLTGDTALADVNPGTTSRTEVILTGAGSCGGASVAANTQEICGGLQYNMILPQAFTELDAPVTLDNAGVETFKVYSDPSCTTEVSYATTTKFSAGVYYAAPASGTPYYGGLSEPGYVNGCDAISKTPDGTSQVTADFIGAADGLKYNIKLATVYTEIGAGITPDGVNEQLDLYTGAGCIGAAAVASGPFYFSGAWYAAVASGSNYYAEFSDTGYVDDQCSATVLSPDGTAQLEPDFTGASAMVYNLLINSATTELDAAITIDGDESVAVYSGAGCVGAAGLASGPVYYNNAWYVAAASDTDYYVQIGEPGYVTACDSAATHPDGTVAFSPTISGSGGDGLLYNIKFSAAFTELDAPITIDGNEGVALYDDSGCTSAVAAASGPFYLGGSWYAAAASGTNYYTAISESGYVTACDAIAKTPDGSAQVIPDFTMAGGDGLEYNIKLSSAATELEAAVTIDGDETFALYTNNDCTGAVAAASGPFFFGASWYVAVASGTGYYGSLTEPGYISACDSTATTPDGDTQMSPSFYGTADGVKYPIKLASAYTETGTLLTPDGSANETVALYSDAGCVTATSVASGPFYNGGAWYSQATSGVDYYVQFTDDGFLGNRCDATAITANNTSQVSPSYNGADAMVYNLKLSSAYSEIGALLTIDGDETVEMFTDSGCVTTATALEVASGPIYYSNTWYVAAASGTDFYARLTEPGFVRDCDDDMTTPDGATQVMPSFSGADALLYNIKLDAAQSELGADLTINGSSGEELIVYDDACSSVATYASAPIYYSGAWYAAVTSGSSYYCSFDDTGMVRSCDSTQVSPAGTAQVTPDFTSADSDGLEYTVKISTVQDELGNSLSVEASDTVALHSIADCSGAASGLATGPIYNTGDSSWYMGVVPGTYYPWYRKAGYVDACAAASVGAATSGQVVASFVGSGLQYGLAVELHDQYGSALTGATLTHGGNPPAYADQGADANLYYFDSTTAGGLWVSLDGYIDIGDATNSVEPGIYATGQTYLTLSGTDYGDIGTIYASDAGANPRRDGLYQAFNARITVRYASATMQYLTGLGNTANFYFEDSAGDRVYPEYFSELNPTANPGVYDFRIATSVVSLQVKAVDADDDPWIDAVESDPLDMTSITENYQNFGPITVYPAADYIMLTPANSTISAGATGAITITAYDNNGVAVSTGPHAIMSVQISMTGGSVSPASEKDIVSTTLTGSTPDAATLLSGTSDTSVIGALTAGVGQVVITDNIITDGNTITMQAFPQGLSLPQYFASSTTSSITVDIQSIVGDMITVIDPTDVTTDATASVRIEIQDEFGNLVDTIRSFRVMVGGNATIGGYSHGDITAGTGTATATVETDGGYVILDVVDKVAETITISVEDPTTVSPLTDTSTQDLVFATGAAAQVVFSSAMPTTGTVGSAANVTCLIQDKWGNTTSSSDRFTIIATGSATNTAVFQTPTTGSAIAGLNTRQITVRANSGTAVVPLRDETVQTVTLSLSDSDSTGYTVTDTAEIAFDTVASLRNAIAFVTTSQTPEAGQWTLYTVRLTDDYGNALSMTVDYDFSVDVLETAHDNTASFSLTSGGTEITSFTLTAGQSDFSFYFMDTLAGSVTLEVSPVTLSQVSNGTLVETIESTDPVDDDQDGVVVSETIASTDTTQPTDLKNAVYYTYSGGSAETILEYPYTDSSDGIIANGSQQGVVRVYLQDKYGNIISGEDVTLVVSGSASVVPDTTQTTDSSGLATFYVSSTSVGTVTFNIDPPGGSSYYGKQNFAIMFTTTDTTPPTMTLMGDDDKFVSLTDGDFLDPSEPLVLTVYLEDPGTSPSGVDADATEITVTDTYGVEISGTTTTTCSTSGGIYTCTVSWDHTGTTLSAGEYDVEITVQDQNGNAVSEEWTLTVEEYAVIKDVLAGGDMPGGVFDPRRGDPLRISFQVPRDNTYITLEIYNRSGRLVYTTTGIFDTGYHEFEWDGIQLNGALPGNGVYMFRLTANINGVVAASNGKFAVFKQ